MRIVKTRQDVAEIIAMRRTTPADEKREEAASVVADLAKFALVRTALSSERSLMAWIRTAVSMYAFGFSVATFADHIQRRPDSAWFLPSIRWLSVVFICLGILPLMLAVIEHMSRLRRMKELGLPAVSRMSLPMVASMLLLVIGLVTLIVIVLNRSL